jgi:hypothetical protein
MELYATIPVIFLDQPSWDSPSFWSLLFLLTLLTVVSKGPLTDVSVPQSLNFNAPAQALVWNACCLVLSILAKPQRQNDLLQDQGRDYEHQKKILQDVYRLFWETRMESQVQSRWLLIVVMWVTELAWKIQLVEQVPHLKSTSKYEVYQ